MIKFNENPFLETGRLMARYCIAYETMKLFQEVDGAQNLNELVKLSILTFFCSVFGVWDSL